MTTGAIIMAIILNGGSAARSLGSWRLQTPYYHRAHPFPQPWTKFTGTLVLSIAFSQNHPSYQTHNQYISQNW